MTPCLRKLKSAIALGTVLLLTAGVLTAPDTGVSAAVQGYTDRALSVITEPTDEFSEYMHLFRGGEEVGLDTLTWTDAGHTGKGILLNGVDEYLQLTNELPLDEGTFSFWINWKGVPQGGSANDLYDQALLTFMDSEGDRATLTPWHRDPALNVEEQPEVSADEGSEDTTASTEETEAFADGIYMSLVRQGEETELDFEMYKPTLRGVSTCLPQNKWHNITFSVYGGFLKIYVDGVLFIDTSVDTRIGRIGLDECRIGASADGDGHLYAVLDDIKFYEVTLDDEQIARLTAGADPLSEESDTDTTPPTTLYTPTAPTTTPSDVSDDTSEDTQDEQTDGFLSDVPPMTWWITGSLLAIVVVLSVIMSFTEPARQARKAEEEEQSSEDSTDEQGGETDE